VLLPLNQLKVEHLLLKTDLILRFPEHVVVTSSIRLLTRYLVFQIRVL
jgi:hypothetical protein